LVVEPVVVPVEDLLEDRREVLEGVLILQVLQGQAL
jgi:hypothetical protein